VIVVSHDPDTAELADRSVRLRDGRVVEDRRGGHGALVVGRGGWVQLPPEMLRDAGIGDRARVRLGSDGLIVSAAGQAGEHGAGAGAGDADLPRLPSAVPPSDGSWAAADVEVRALVRARGRGAGRRQVIEDLSRAFAPGRMTAITGRSGSGKTTLVRILAGIDVPDSGSVTIDDRALGGLDPERRAAIRRERIGYLPQEPSPIDFLSAEENVALALRMRGWGIADAARRASVSLAWVGLSERARQHVARLSAGEAQRVALARALASARGLLIVDEPTSRLDEAGAGTMAELLAAAAVHDHQTVICATHDPQVIRHADEVIALGG
jgi:putative ABC transport system ATP-binding protein